MSQSDTGEVTRLLHAAGRGDREAQDRLIPIIYQELRHRAAASLRGERADHTLQTTALVNEAWLRLTDQEEVEWSDRAHFFAVAATCIRRILVDHARRRKAAKRGGGVRRVALDEIDEDLVYRAPEELLAMDEVLTHLAELDQRKARVVELRFFGGLQMSEVARVLDTSLTTVERDLRLARAWLHRELSGDEEA